LFIKYIKPKFSTIEKFCNKKIHIFVINNKVFLTIKKNELMGYGMGYGKWEMGYGIWNGNMGLGWDYDKWDGILGFGMGFGMGWEMGFSQSH